jgi:integrase
MPDVLVEDGSGNELGDFDILGLGVRLLAALAGHSHISTTQRYIDVNSEQLSEAVELL